jgi:anti-sigma factor RsiW
METSMTCISPPEITDIQLLAHADGKADRQVVAHLEQCPHCRQRANQLAQFQERMIAQLYRLMCPSPHELGEYHLGMLPGAEGEAIRRHLVECPHCTQEIAQLRNYLSDLTADVEFSVAEKVQVWIAQLVERGTSQASGVPLALAPAGVGLRGEKEEPHIYQVGGVQIAIESQPDPQSPGQRILLGLIMGIEGGGWTAHLWQDNRLISAASVDDLGNFVIPGLASGHYQLILTGTTTEVHVQALEI